MMQAISTVGTPTMCRVAWLEPGIIMKLLDAGAFGIVCPMINTRDECERFVGACRYPPQRLSQLRPVRAQWTYGADYFKNSNDSVITMAMIETKQAVENLEDYSHGARLDSIYIGPNDLRSRMAMVRQACRPTRKCSTRSSTSSTPPRSTRSTRESTPARPRWRRR
jgi:4-hydroxy-2-oxoheptanedioate aldolase